MITLPAPPILRVLPPRITIAQIPSRSDTRVILREHEGERRGSPSFRKRLSDTLPKCAMGSASEPAGPVAFRATPAIAPKPIFSEPNRWIGD